MLLQPVKIHRRRNIPAQHLLGKLKPTLIVVPQGFAYRLIIGFMYLIRLLY